MTDTMRAYLTRRMALLKSVAIGGLVLAGALGLNLRRALRSSPAPIS